MTANFTVLLLGETSKAGHTLGGAIILPGVNLVHRSRPPDWKPRVLADDGEPMAKERKAQTDGRRCLILDNAGMALEIALGYR